MQNAHGRASTENGLLVLNPSPTPDHIINSGPLENGRNGGNGTAEFSRWVENLTFDLFLENSKKARFRLIDLASENPLPFLPRFNDRNNLLLLEVGLIEDVNARMTQPQFL